MLLPRPVIAGTALLSLLEGVTAGQRNVTIDDAEKGAPVGHTVPTYSPTNGWSTGSSFTQLDASKIHGGTWHDGTYHPGDAQPKEVNFAFTGVSLYIYCIIANTPPGRFFDAFADYKILIDGELAGEYRHDVENIPDYFYNTTVFATNTTLENKSHNVTIRMDSTEKPVLLLFDYAVYTMIEDDAVVPPSTTAQVPATTPGQPAPASDQPLSTTDTPVPDQPSSSDHVGIIVGAVLGGLSISLISAIGVLVYIRRRRMQRARKQAALRRQWRGSRFLAHSRIWRWILNLPTEPETRMTKAPIPVPSIPVPPAMVPTHQTPTSRSFTVSRPPESVTDLESEGGDSSVVAEIREIREALVHLRAQQRAMTEALDAPPPYAPS
ncbi:hypothetical protein CCMSSC00406_0006768 [Pleurotus cornucopiae]|uniref:Uncharacterized protein n=1 Tax=Pleurotus cornucopiae TaxID=5321 RepID=A0ACB7J265_PLECO|nr:hypothetical protein CCMSSC00406_0006768 [Pleurotus cornucopiae]